MLHKHNVVLGVNSSLMRTQKNRLNVPVIVIYPMTNPLFPVVFLHCSKQRVQTP